MRFVISGNSYEITRDTIPEVVNGHRPDPRDGRHKFYVEIGGLEFPIKQVLHLATGLPKGAFYAHDARRVLTRLDFKVEEFPPPRPLQALATTKLASPPDDSQQPDTDVRKFAVTLDQDEDGFVLVSCPALPGCHSQGRTSREALNNIAEAIRGYIASMQKHQEEVPDVDWEVVEVAL